jgi:hypothetical protein
LLADGKNNELRVAYNNLLTTLWALMTDVNERLSQPEPEPETEPETEPEQPEGENVTTE